MTLKELNNALRDLLCTQAKDVSAHDILLVLNLYVETFRALETVEHNDGGLS